MFEGPDLERTAVVVALGQAAAHARQRRRGVLGLDTFGDDPEVEVPTEVDDGPDDAVRRRVGPDREHERLVDLQLGGRQRGEVRERRVARPEVVDRDADPQFTKLVEDTQRPLGVGHHRRFGQLHHHPVGRHRRCGQRRCDRVDDAGFDEVVGRQVERHPKIPTLVAPTLGLGDGEVQHEPGQRADESGVLRDVDELVGRNGRAARLRPPDERFDADDGARGEIDLGLVVEDEFSAVDGGSQPTDEGQALRAVVVTVGGVGLDHRPIPLRGVHGDVGLPQQGVGIGDAVDSEGDADAGADLGSDPGNGHRPFELGGQIESEFLHLVACG